MGQSEILEFSGEARRNFMRALLYDLRALEFMLERGLFEEGVARIGAEQELFLVDRACHPALASLAMLERLKDPHFTTELGAFQLEINLDPQDFGGACLSRLERQLEDLVARARLTAHELGLEIVLTGILPTIRKSDLGLESMVPLPRYKALNDATTRLRGDAYYIHIRGVDELRAQHDSVMVEACNASFQMHLQVSAKEFANAYNIAQVVTGPVLAAATNSPILWGRRLWAETRIALFEQAVDSRNPGQAREMAPRVTFGNRWVRRSVFELYKEDIGRFRALVGTDLDEDPLAEIAAGRAPALKALRLHNGTIYRWNRACYGITNGKPHLRIENRVLPSGPSTVDEVANGAFWLGLMNGLMKRHEDVTKLIEFEQAKLNFVAAARLGLGSSMTWLDGRERPTTELIADHLLPIAAEGLDAAGILAVDRDRYLRVIEQRVRTGRTGSRWLMFSLAGMKDHGTQGERLNALTSATIARQTGGTPVSEWEPGRLDEGGGRENNYLKVEQYMTTDLYTVHPDEPVDLVVKLMEWHKIRHVPVEDHEHRLIGIVSYRSLLRLLSDPELASRVHGTPVSEVMKKDPFIVSPTRSTLRAIELMREYGVGCLPVVADGRLVGLVTGDDFMGIAGQLLEERLRD
jgi:CBS domain-containing protein/gamma-glutamyl:cysteine ligase YbdK (ATP-grasp superfamily)